MLFQSTLPYGSDWSGCRSCRLRSYFNPRSLTGATAQYPVGIVSSVFQSTLPRGSDKLKLPCTMLPIVFQSTLPCGSDQSREQGIISLLRFQSTLPCGSDFKVKPPVIWVSISIHAPLRERLNAIMHLLSPLAFQSTLPCGSDYRGYCKRVQSSGISIHAPLRERLRTNFQIRNTGRFQSTLPCGSDNNIKFLPITKINFNPRSLAGATLRNQL